LTGDVTSVGNATTLANTANVQSVIASNIPAGSIWDFAGSSAPTGWLICDGSSQLRASFATLFAVIGTTYGSVDGTHFSLPDLRGRVSLGVGSVGTHTQPTKALATTGGSDAALLTHTHTGPSHSHGGGTGNDSPDHAHTESYFPSAFGQPWDGVTAGPGGIMSGAGGSTASGQVTQGANARHAHSISADGTGPTGAPNISTTSDSLSPFIALNKIIKT
jgi:microcystin-dependent protein